MNKHFTLVLKIQQVVLPAFYVLFTFTRCTFLTTHNELNLRWELSFHDKDFRVQHRGFVMSVLVRNMDYFSKKSKLNMMTTKNSNGDVIAIIYGVRYVWSNDFYEIWNPLTARFYQNSIQINKFHICEH